MRSLGNSSAASLQNGMSSSLIDEFNTIESAIDAEIDEAPLEFSLYSQGPAAVCQNVHLFSESVVTCYCFTALYCFFFLWDINAF